MSVRKKSTESDNERTDGQKRAAERKRDYATVVYPDSAPEGWMDILGDLHVAAFVSPLHDKDQNPDGTLKKPHWHVMLMFDSPKDYESQVKPLIESFGGVGREKVASRRGYARYLIHRDNPEKYQYEASQVVAFGGADYDALTRLPMDDEATLKEIFRFLQTNEIFSIAEFLDLTAETKPEWFTLVTSRKAYIVDKVIKSLAWERQSGYIRIADRQVEVDPKTGEAKVSSPFL